MIIYIILLVNVISAGIYFILTRRASDKYIKELLKDRHGKDTFMKGSTASPFSGGEKFKGLKYFSPNLKYKIKATLIKIQSGKSVPITTSTGEEQNFSEYAFVEFELDGIKNRLLIFEPENTNHPGLFLAFKDLTSSKETYGAGRYLDVDKAVGASIVLDFNKAYNPYCAYNESYNCPFPPRENHLTIAIKAGEKKYR